MCLIILNTSYLLLLLKTDNDLLLLFFDHIKQVKQVSKSDHSNVKLFFDEASFVMTIIELCKMSSIRKNKLL